jgi:tRNA nucleotidyltransferase/poly(A) polymerase
VVSAERIATELRKMLLHPNRAAAARLLWETNLLEVILPESRLLFHTDALRQVRVPSELWQNSVGILDRLSQPTFRVALAALLWGICRVAAQSEETIDQVCARWKLSSHEHKGAAWLVAHEPLVRRASTLPWPKLQRILLERGVEELVTLAEAVAGQLQEDPAEIAFCRAKLQLPSAQLNPPPLITGDDLRQAGFVAGPQFRRLLEEVRDAQLEGRITSHHEALQLARALTDR